MSPDKMLSQRLSALLLLVASAQAFRNAAPFLMLSTERLDSDVQSREVASSQQILDDIISSSTEGACGPKLHLIVSQPGLSTSDLQHMPQLRTVVNAKAWTSRIEIPNVLGEMDGKQVQSAIAEECGSKHISAPLGSDQVPAELLQLTEPSVVLLLGSGLMNVTQDRSKDLAQLDAFFDTHLTRLLKTQPLTFVLVSEPVAASQTDGSRQYEMDDAHQAVLHQDLKRDVGLHFRASNSSRSNSSNDHFQDGLPLFERYQYLSPPLFMGLTVSLLLFVILYVGISAIAGLSVSYKAFSKEMAPQNQKGKQQ